MKQKGLGKGVFVIILVIVGLYIFRTKVLRYEPVKRLLEKPAVKPAEEKAQKPETPPVVMPAQPKPAPAEPVKAPAPVVPEKPAPPPAKEKAAPEKKPTLNIETILSNPDRVEARKILTRKLLAAESEEEYQQIKKALDELNEQLFYSKTSPVDGEFYTVQSGDTLYGIAKKFGSTVGLIMWANKKSRPIARLGEKLKVPVGTLKLLIDKSDRRLIVLFNNQYIKEYPVGVGKNNSTPVGTFIIETKIEKPDWYTPDGRKIPYGNPENILGTRWMGFKETPRYSGYGIHGTTIPERVGKAMTSGCVCMYNEDVEDLFRAVPYGAEVVIRE